MGLDQYITVEYDEGEEVTKYFRKFSFLREWLVKNTELTEGSNLEPVEIPHEKLKELHETCTKVLNQEIDHEESLPRTEGFFFGSTDYDTWYWQELQVLKDDLEELLNLNKIKKITYVDWW